MGKKVKSFWAKLFTMQTSKLAFYVCIALFALQTIATFVAIIVNEELGARLSSFYDQALKAYGYELATYSFKAGYENGKKIPLNTPQPVEQQSFTDG